MCAVSSHLFDLLRQYGRFAAKNEANREVAAAAYKVFFSISICLRFSLSLFFSVSFSLSLSLCLCLCLSVCLSSSLPLRSPPLSLSSSLKSLFCLQAMTVVVRDYHKHSISEEELRLLLSFVDEDVHDYTRHSTAFPLLKVMQLSCLSTVVLSSVGRFL